MTVYESAFSVALTELPEHIESAKKMSHDTVIVNTGPDRLTGVTWSFHPALAVLAGVADIGDITIPAEIIQICMLYPSGVLVIATVEVRP